MSDEENKGADDTAQATAETTAQTGDETGQTKSGGSAERFYSEADVNRIVQERLKRERKAEAGETQKAKPVKKASKPEDNSELVARLDRIERDKAFSDALLDASVSLTQGQRKILRRAFDGEAPEDVNEWLAQAIADLGVSKAETKAADKSTSNGNGSHGNGSNGSSATVMSGKVEDLERGQIHPNKLTKEQVERMGPAKTYEYVKKFIGRA